MVIFETLPLPLVPVVIHGHFMNPPPPHLTTWYMDAPLEIIISRLCFISLDIIHGHGGVGGGSYSPF